LPLFVSMIVRKYTDYYEHALTGNQVWQPMFCILIRIDTNKS